MSDGIDLYQCEQLLRQNDFFRTIVGSKWVNLYAVFR